MPGPPPTPTGILKAAGSWRADGRLDEPEAGGNLPLDPPEYLNTEAARKWRQLEPYLSNLLIAGRIDTDVLAQYCVVYARWREAEMKVEETGGLVVGMPNGYPGPNPYLSIVDKTLDQLHKIGQQLGLTPASRTRVKKIEQPKQG
ncbi:MAG TPA: phage terminase small subunit P27 family, partial [Tepidisphaeraceae bacterium]|nr:phage terminase small subunit P27 family [Tepidisphaeraceae bacterium]